MNATAKVMKFELYDLARSKWLLFYSLFFFLITDALFRFGEGGVKVILSVMNVVLFVIPLVSIVFGVIFYYNSREFQTLLLTQPLERKALFKGMYLGVASPLVAAFLIGTSLPFLVHNAVSENLSVLLTLLLAGGALTLTFVSLAFWVATTFDEKIKSFGFAILLWLFLAVIFDGLVLLFAFIFADYPLEKGMIAVSLMNPIDLARIMLLMQTDYSALMGYTGAIFNKFFGGNWGIVAAGSFMVFWTLLPLARAMKKFGRKDM